MKKDDIIIITPDGLVPDVQLIFIAQNDPINARSKFVGTPAELLSGLACVINTLIKKVGVAPVLFCIRTVLSKVEKDLEDNFTYHDDDPIE